LRQSRLYSSLLGLALLVACFASAASLLPKFDLSAVAWAEGGKPKQILFCKTYKTTGEKALFLQQKPLAQGTLFWLEIPASSPYVVLPKVSLAGLSSVASLRDENAVASINAGYFDPKNSLTSAFVQMPEQTLLSPEDNAQLMENPALAQWLPAILNRSEWRILTCGKAKTVVYQMARHNEPISLKGCTLNGLMGAGPQLLPKLTTEEEGFYAKNAQGKVVRDPISSFSGRARSAIGLKADGSVILAVVQQPIRLKGKGGATLPELAEALKGLGVVQALNLDGGSSSALWEKKNGTVFATVNSSGEKVARKVLSTLQVVPVLNVTTP
jgi:hypothetical protein